MARRRRPALDRKRPAPRRGHSRRIRRACRGNRARADVLLPSPGRSVRHRVESFRSASWRSRRACGWQAAWRYARALTASERSPSSLHRAQLAAQRRKQAEGALTAHGGPVSGSRVMRGLPTLAARAERSRVEAVAAPEPALRKRVLVAASRAGSMGDVVKGSAPGDSRFDDQCPRITRLGALAANSSRCLFSRTERFAVRDTCPHRSLDTDAEPHARRWSGPCTRRTGLSRCCLSASRLVQRRAHRARVV